MICDYRGIIMKITAVVGTSRKNGQVSTMCKKVLEGAETNGHETEIINLYDYKIEPCIGCWRCNKSEKCFQEDDFDKIYKKLEDSDVIVVGSPCYWGNVTGILTNFFDRHIPYMFQPSDIPAIKHMTFKQKISYLMNITEVLIGLYLRSAEEYNIYKPNQV